jgi:WbqC-like protein family
MIVAIHQPNFFPWLGYFDKIARSDVFCLMDNAQLPKTGGTWVNRVKVSVAGQGAWITAAVERGYSGVRAIHEVTTSNAIPWRDKILRSLQASYGRAACFKEVFPLVEELMSNPDDQLARYNEHAVRRLSEAMGLRRARLVRGSDLAVTGHATDLLVSMTRAMGGDAYLCGGGAGGYQEDGKFAAAGVALLHQDFRHPVYDQNGGEFLPGLSIIDALMHCGLEGTRRLIGDP